MVMEMERKPSALGGWLTSLSARRYRNVTVVGLANKMARVAWAILSAMVINGKSRMACTALIDKVEQPILLQALVKFLVLRNLSVDCPVLFENLEAVGAWVPVGI